MPARQERFVDGVRKAEVVAAGGEVDVGFGESVEIGASGRRKVVAVGELQEEGAVLGLVVGVVDFEAVEAGVGEVVDDGGEVGGVGSAELDGVGEGGQAAGGVDAVDGLARGEAFFVEVG